MYFFQMWFQFKTLHLVRVLVTWSLFLFSLTGNVFVVWCLRKRSSRANHFIMFHLALSDLVYTVFVMPSGEVAQLTGFNIT